MVIRDYSSSLFAMDMTTAQVLWRANYSWDTYSTPAIVPGFRSGTAVIAGYYNFGSSLTLTVLEGSFLTSPMTAPQASSSNILIPDRVLFKWLVAP